MEKEIILDKYKRTFFKKPSFHKMNIYNRPDYFMNSNAFTHANDIIIDIYYFITSAGKKINILGLISDNGVDFCPSNYLVFVALGKLWKSLDLNQLFALSFAPYNSRYNYIETARGNMSMALAQHKMG